MNQRLWIKKAIALGAIFFFAILLVKPIGVSTQYSVLSGIVYAAFDEDLVWENNQRSTGYESSNAYYDKSDGALAKSIMNPWNYDFVFVLAIPLGAYAAYVANDKRRRSQMSDFAENKNAVHKSFWRRYLPSFLGGFILLYGARMADGCTSGHMMSGMMQGSVSGYLFAIVTFAIAIPVAVFSGKMVRGGRR